MKCKYDDCYGFLTFLTTEGVLHIDVVDRSTHKPGSYLGWRREMVKIICDKLV